ncbi:lasso peptide biosynthesis B2 protein [Rhodohalobacter sp. SW132]|uniref:lasso peptide biosynthesis B2 protein n=1 Tax=Rhodohalobacter sp. SW132 TaxID=2293433 RepID=UPI001F2C482A|nr:lasso peptide biosynthesis B2 protein [Rhodohalobacter sp. SW132]
MIRFLPFRVLKRLVGGSEGRVHDRQDRSHLESGSIMEMETTIEASDGAVETVQDIVRAVRSVSRRTPWESKCLVQSSAAKIMMNKAGIPSELCLGVLKPGSAQRSESGKNEMRPHAWLIAENHVVLGGENLEQYVMVSRFR